MRKTPLYSAITSVALSLGLAVPVMAITVDGTVEKEHGAAASTQTTQTQFGNSNSGNVASANGSELDVAYARRIDKTLHLFLAGNMESNFNKVEIFIDCIPGGQNKLRGDNPNVDFDGLNRMGDDGGGNGLRFDTGFEADFWIGATVGDPGGGIQLFANYAELLTAGGGTGYYLGQTGAGSSDSLTGGKNPHGIKVAFNNSNTGGVNDGCGASSGTGVTTGLELEIPIAALGGSGGPFRVCAFVNGGGHNFVSNQVLGPLPAGTCNLGEPRIVDFSAIAGDQFFTSTNAVPIGSPWLLLVVSGMLLVSATMVLRRRANA